MVLEPHKFWLQNWTIYCGILDSLLLCPRERLRSIVISMSVSVCLSVRISPEPHVPSLPNFLWCSLCPWLGPPATCLRLAASRIAGKGFSSLLKMHYRPGNGGWECTARTKYAIYDCLVILVRTCVRVTTLLTINSSSVFIQPLYINILYASDCLFQKSCRLLNFFYIVNVFA